MTPQSQQELAKEYLALVHKKIASVEKVRELCAAWLAKRLAKTHRTKDEKVNIDGVEYDIYKSNKLQ